MNPLWLLLIVPATAMFTLIITSLLWAADDSDARMIALLKTQYEEMRKLSASKTSDTGPMAFRHAKERQEIIG
jgi:hypothetical protein